MKAPTGFKPRGRLPAQAIIEMVKSIDRDTVTFLNNAVALPEIQAKLADSLAWHATLAEAVEANATVLRALAENDGKVEAVRDSLVPIVQSMNVIAAQAGMQTRMFSEMMDAVTARMQAILDVVAEQARTNAAILESFGRVQAAMKDMPKALAGRREAAKPITLEVDRDTTNMITRVREVA